MQVCAFEKGGMAVVDNRKCYLSQYEVFMVKFGKNHT